MHSRSLLGAFTELAEDSSNSFAVDQLQDLQTALESMLDCGDAAERVAAAFLLQRVNEAIGTLLPKPVPVRVTGAPVRGCKVAHFKVLL